MSLFRALLHRPFALLWSGQTISRLGDRFYNIAMAWWVLEKTGSAAAMGAMLIFSSVPMLIFLLIGGIAVDRYSRGRLMLASDVLRGIVVAMVTTLALVDALQIWHVYLASVVFGFVSAFFQPAYTAIIPDITPREFLPSANSLTSLSGQITGIAGPALGAIIIGLGGTSIAFAFDALSFFISALCLLPIIGLLANAPRTRSSGMLHEFRQGVTAVFASPWLWITITLAGFMNLTQAGPWSVALPFFVKQNLNANVDTLGLLFSMSSLGAVLASVWLGHTTRLRRRGAVAYLSLVIWGAMEVMVALALPLPFVLAAALVWGGSLAAFNLIWTNTLQELVPRDLLGRVASIDGLGSFALLPIGYGVAGWATDLIGPGSVLIMGGALTAMLATLGLLHPAIRGLE